MHIRRVIFSAILSAATSVMLAASANGQAAPVNAYIFAKTLPFAASGTQFSAIWLAPFCTIGGALVSPSPNGASVDIRATSGASGDCVGVDEQFDFFDSSGHYVASATVPPIQVGGTFTDTTVAVTGELSSATFVARTVNTPTIIQTSSQSQGFTAALARQIAGITTLQRPSDPPWIVGNCKIDLGKFSIDPTAGHITVYGAVTPSYCAMNFALDLFDQNQQYISTLTFSESGTSGLSGFSAYMPTIPAALVGRPAFVIPHAKIIKDTAPVYKVVFDSIDIANTRSRHLDTDYAALGVQINGQPIRTVKKSLGDLNNGPANVGLEIDGLTLTNPSDVLSVAYSVANMGHSNVKDEVEAEAVETGVDAILQLANAAPVVGQVFDAAWEIGLRPLVFADCDGVVVADRLRFEAAPLESQTLAQTTPLTLPFGGGWTAHAPPYSIAAINHYNGSNSPHGCGGNSFYLARIFVERTN